MWFDVFWIVPFSVVVILDILDILDCCVLIAPFFFCFFSFGFAA